MSDGRPRSVSDEAILEAVRSLVEAGDRDDGNGGVRPDTVAAELDAPTPTIRKHIFQLADAGELARVWGWGPDSNEPRMSFLPADHPDA